MLVRACLLFLLLAGGALPALAGEAPPLMRAGVYQGGIDLGRYWVSEKLDGVRAYWDGRQLASRAGNLFQAPPWFTAGFPPTALDGELWMGRGSYEALSGAVRRKAPIEAEWRRIRYLVFDLPASQAPFTRRLAAMREIVQGAASPYLALVDQSRIASHAALMQRLEEVMAGGGEGLMLHRGSARYQIGRTKDLLKVKAHEDAEAVVLAHLPGKGKFAGMMGALLVETPEGRRFRIGTGFSGQERQAPPPLGATITYRHYGKTGKGTPRFASFLRVRREEPPAP